jgi:hypothetical protein
MLSLDNWKRRMTPQSAPSVRSWSLRFAASALTAAVVVAGIGWVTDLRDVMHGALISVAVVALLPLVIVAAGLGLALLIVTIGVFVAALSGGDTGAVAAGVDGGAALATLGGEIAPAYYRFLGRRRHPLFWGPLAGLLLGGLVSLGLIAWRIIPRETATALILANAQTRIETIFDETGRFPEPDAQGHLHASVLNGDVDDAAVLKDGFSRPIRYELFEKSGINLSIGSHEVISSKKGWYLLTSLGFDGKPSRDDLQIESQPRRLGRDSRLSRLAEAGPALDRVAQVVRDLLHQENQDRTAALSVKLRAVQSLRKGRK